MKVVFVQLVLAAPIFAAPFKLEVDASAAGAGALLLQEDSAGIDHPVCYFSKMFSRAQDNYSTIEKEALALLWMLQHFEVSSSLEPQPFGVSSSYHTVMQMPCLVYECQHLLSVIFMG